VLTSGLSITSRRARAGIRHFFYFPVIWKEQVVLVVGAAFSHDHLTSRLKAAPTGDFLW
jgi:hypothetical protein